MEPFPKFNFDGFLWEIKFGIFPFLKYSIKSIYKLIKICFLKWKLIYSKLYILVDNFQFVKLFDVLVIILIAEIRNIPQKNVCSESKTALIVVKQVIHSQQNILTHTVGGVNLDGSWKNVIATYK